ncbi:MAG: STAS domain-containing protein [bacterium]|nr:STAS domain-containing protein [bacterium]
MNRVSAPDTALLLRKPGTLLEADGSSSDRSVAADQCEDICSGGHCFAATTRMRYTEWSRRHGSLASNTKRISGRRIDCVRLTLKMSNQEVGMSVWKKMEWEHLKPENPGVVLFRVTGAMNGNKTCYEFLDEVRQATKGDYRYMVINVEGVERMTSSGIGIICACVTSVANSDGQMYLVGVTERNRALMEIVGLWDQITHFPTEEDVVFAAPDESFRVARRKS